MASMNGHAKEAHEDICDHDEFVEYARGWMRNRPSPSQASRGLTNMGNTCFLNATLQCLASSATLRNFIVSEISYTKTLSRNYGEACRSIFGLRGTREITHDAHKLLAEGHGLMSTPCLLLAADCHPGNWLAKFEKCMTQVFKKVDQQGPEFVGSLRPTPFVNDLNLVIKAHRKGAQEDAHEYAVNLLDMLHEQAVDNAKKLHNLTKDWVRKNQTWQLTSPIYEIFGGMIRSQVTCAACNYQSNTYDPVTDLSLEIGKHCNKVEDCLSMFTDIETLGTNNAYTCDRCKLKTRATKQLTMHTLPNVLILHLKRFDPYSSYGGKITRTITCPLELEMAGFVSDDGRDRGDNSQYSLYAVLCHKGMGAHSGHYYSYAIANGRWYKHDDSCTSPVDEMTVLTDEAYMAFYTRHEPRVEKLEMIKEDPPDSTAYAESQASTQPSMTLHSTVNGHDYEAVIGPALPPNGLQALRDGVHTSSSSSGSHQTVLGVGQNAGSALTRELLDDLDELNGGDEEGARAVGLKREREEGEGDDDDDDGGGLDGSGRRTRKLLKVMGGEKKVVVDGCLESKHVRECVEKTRGLLEREFGRTPPLSGDIMAYLWNLFESNKSSEDGWGWKAKYRDEAQAGVRHFGKRMREAGAKHLTDLLNNIARTIQKCQ